MKTPVFTVLILVLGTVFTTSLNDSECPAGTQKFPGQSDCLSLEDYCFSDNRIVGEDKTSCGDQCADDQKPSYDGKTCVQTHCKKSPNHQLNSDNVCIPCPAGQKATADGLSCIGQYNTINQV